MKLIPQLAMLAAGIGLLVLLFVAGWNSAAMSGRIITPQEAGVAMAGLYVAVLVVIVIDGKRGPEKR